MLLRGRIAVVAALVGAAVVAPSSASGAGWRTIPSGTTEDITAVEYRGPDTFLIATGGGKILRRVGGTFQLVATVPGTAFRDIELSPDGTVGLAVGTGGVLLRSTNGGASWSTVTLPNAGSRTSETNCTATEAPGDLDSVRISSQGDAWILGPGTQVWRTAQKAAADIGTGWVYANKGPGSGCAAVVGDADDVFLPPATDAATFVTRSFGAVYATPHWSSSAATRRPADAGNGFVARRRLAGDVADPTRQWAVSPDGPGPSYVQRTEDGWSTATSWTLAGGGDQGALTDVDHASGTVLAAGLAGAITSSSDGRTFFRDGAGTANDWNAVSLADAANGAVGGDGGALVVTAQANVDPASLVPAPPPAGGPGGAGGAGGAGGGGGGGGATGSNPPVAGVLTGPGPRVASVAPGTFRISPIVVTGSRRRWGVAIRGSLRPPSGVTARQGCAGEKLSIRLLKGRRALARRTVTLDSRCAFAATLRVARARVGKAHSLGIALAFGGSPSIARTARTITARIRG